MLFSKFPEDSSLQSRSQVHAASWELYILSSVEFEVLTGTVTKILSSDVLASYLTLVLLLGLLYNPEDSGKKILRNVR
jgi:hypothetical protein